MKKAGRDSTNKASRSGKKQHVPDYRAMIEQAAHGVFVHRDLQPLYANEAFAQLCGYDTAQAIMALTSMRFMISEEDLTLFDDSLELLRRKSGASKAAMVRLRMVHKKGHEIWLAMTQSLITWQNEPAVEWHVFDISDQARFERQLLMSEQRLRSMLEVLPYPVMIAKREDGRILFVNRKTCLLLGQSANALLKASIAEFFVQRSDYEDFLTMLDAIKEVREQEIGLCAHSGRKFLAELAAIAIDYAGQPALLLALNDISARKQLEAELFRQASTDALTGISNRRYFLARGEQELRRARRFARPLSVMMMDIDHFKRINDLHGHAGGDHTLQEFVKIGENGLRGTDVMGRLGGEEFAVLMPETGLQAAMDVANRLRLSVADQPISLGKKTLLCTVSIGVAQLTPQDTTIDDLLHRADEALYRAKQKGRNQVIGAE